MNAQAYAKNGMQIRNDERFCSYAILFINVRYLVAAAKKWDILCCFIVSTLQ